MSTPGSRIPSANSPQLLTRMLEAVARGVRTTRGLSEALGVQAQTVRAYVHAGEWLALCGGEPLALSPLGLELVYAGARQPQVYLRAVWSNALAAELLISGDGRLPELDHVERVLEQLDPELAPATVRRRASAVRSLVAPAVGRPRPRSRGEGERQVALPLGHAVAATTPPPATLSRAGRDDPDAYRFVWSQLLDHGELSVGQLRSLLDRGGAPHLPLGALVEMAIRRGDAARMGDRLVATTSSVRMRALAGSAVAVALSDPDYRAYLQLKAGEVRPLDAHAERFEAWNQRLFGQAERPKRVSTRLRQVLLDRGLEDFPRAPGPQPAPNVVEAPFLQTWAQAGLTLALPPTLAQLQGGPSAIHRLLEASRGGSPVSLPTVVDPPVAVHGGLVHPGERPPPEVDGILSLRRRGLRCAPGVALLAAFLLLHRQRPGRLAVVLAPPGWCIRARAEDPRPLFDALDGFAVHRRWTLVRHPGGLDAETMLRALQAIGVLTLIGRQAVLSEELAVRLAASPDDEVSLALQALSEAVDAWLDA